MIRKNKSTKRRGAATKWRYRSDEQIENSFRKKKLLQCNTISKALRTKEQLKAEVARWAEIIKVKPVQVRFQRMKLKWASCSPKGWISFNKDLIHEPRVFQEYVIVHELLHLQVPNHGRLFKSLMNAYLPEWKSVLKRESSDYTLWQRDLFIERSIEDTSKTAMKRK